MSRLHPFFDHARPHLFAHQGASGEAPSNTLTSFQRAVDLGIVYLETDCHATSDGEVVLCHDPTVDATSDGEGEIASFHYSELQELDAGYRFSPDGKHFPFRGRGVRIPRLAELLERFPEARINLEIKQGELEVVREVIRIIEAADASQRVLLAAAEDEVMRSIRSLAPRTAIGSSLGDLVAFFQAIAEERVERFRPEGMALQMPTEFAGNSLVTPEALAAAHRHGLLVHIWTINDPAEMKRLLEAGVDGVMSDYPEQLLKVAAACASGR